MYGSKANLHIIMIAIIIYLIGCVNYFCISLLLLVMLLLLLLVLLPSADDNLSAHGM